jgi:hypothetical protein
VQTCGRTTQIPLADVQFFFLQYESLAQSELVLHTVGVVLIGSGVVVGHSPLKATFSPELAAEQPLPNVVPEQPHTVESSGQN